MNTAVEQVSQAIQPEAETTIEAPKETTEAPADEPEAPAKEEDVAFPKKAVNAISRRDKMIGKLRAEIAMLKQAQPAAAPAAPKEEEFDNYGDFLKAQLKHEMSQENPKDQPAEEKSIYGNVDPMWVQEREEYAVEKAQEYAKAIPDFQELMVENADLIDSLPGNIQKLFLEADDPAAAAYNLAKEGKLSILRGMSEARAALLISQAEAKGIQPSKTVSKAPAPITANKGTVNGGQDAGNLSADDLLKIVKRK